MPIQNFKEIIAWQKAHILVLEVYKVTKNFPKSEDFNLTSQMRRCSTSIPSNIAEGFKRKTKKDKYHFSCMAEGSLEELKYQILLAKDLGYLEAETYDIISIITDEVGRLLTKWKNYT